jgi:hypothetical protein
MNWSTSTGRTWCTPPGSRSLQKTLIDYIYYRYGLFGVIGVIGGLTKGGVLLKRGLLKQRGDQIVPINPGGCAWKSFINGLLIQRVNAPTVMQSQSMPGLELL